MTVLDNTPRDQYTATGGQVAFPYTFEITAEGDIAVLQNGVLLSLGAGAGEYAVTGVGSDSGGVITLVTGATAGDIITLYRDMALERLTGYTNGGDFLAADVNNDYDRLWLALQQGAADTDRSVRKPNSDSSAINMVLPVAASRAQKLLAFNSSGAVTVQPYLNNETIVLSVQVEVGDGVTTTYSLETSTNSPSLLQIAIDGVLQEVSSYGVSGGNLVFSAAPPLQSAIEIRAFVQKEIVSTDLKASDFTGDGSTTSFTLGYSAVKPNTFVYIDGVYQFKNTYSVSGTTITFSTAPPLNSVIEVVIAAFTTSVIATPSADSVGTAQLQDNAVTTAKIADDAVTAAKLASDAVVTASIVDDNVTQAKIADDAVGADQLASSAVVTASIVDDAVTAAKIADGTITGTNVSSEIKVAGLETIYVPAAGMYPETTNGCADLEQVELSNGPELKCLDFAADADDFAQFQVIFPKSWNEGTVTFQAFFTVTGTNTGTVAWGLAARSFADSADINTAFGTQVVATPKAHSGTSNDLDVAAVSGAVTIAGAAADCLTIFQIARDVSADTQTGAARLLGIKLLFTTDASNDA